MTAMEFALSQENVGRKVTVLRPLGYTVHPLGYTVVALGALAATLMAICLAGFEGTMVILICAQVVRARAGEDSHTEGAGAAVDHMRNDGVTPVTTETDERTEIWIPHLDDLMIEQLMDLDLSKPNVSADICFESQCSGGDIPMSCLLAIWKDAALEELATIFKLSKLDSFLIETSCVPEPAVALIRGFLA